MTMELKHFNVPGIFIKSMNVFIVYVTVIILRIVTLLHREGTIKKRQKSHVDVGKRCHHDLFDLKLEDAKSMLAQKSHSQKGKTIPESAASVEIFFRCVI